MVNNTDISRFLQEIFPDHAKHAIFANAKYDPAAKKLANWQHFRDIGQLDSTRDCFVSPAAFPDDGDPARTGDRVVEVRALVIDDVGGQIPQADVLRGLGQPPTFEVLTSRGNAHWWYRLAKPVPAAEWRAFFAEVERRIGHDLDGAEPHHVFRLPMGVNTKAKRNGFRPGFGQINPSVMLDAAGIMLFAEPALADTSSDGGGCYAYRDMMGLAEVLPNPDSLLRRPWVTKGYQFKSLAIDDAAAWRAFELWSKKSAKWYDGDDTEKLWRGLKPKNSGRELLVEIEALDGGWYRGWINREAQAAFDDGEAPPPSPFDGVEFFVDQERSAIEVVRHLGGTVRQIGRGDWREFVPDTGRWREWTGDHMFRRVLELVNERKKRPLDPEVAKKLTSVKFIEHIAHAAALHTSVIAKVTDFDQAPLLLGVPSGVVDLGPGMSRAIRRGQASEMVSKTMWVDPAPVGTPHPQWSRFLKEFTYGKSDLEEWLQVRAGYCLTGLMDEYIMPFYHGSGGNGKSVYLNALRSVWGEYGTQMDHRLLFEKHGGYHLAPLAVLAGVRLAIVTDVPQAAVWDVLIMKMLTGDDAITANRMHQNPVTFKSTAKVDVSGNGEPVVKDMDEGIARRLMAIPLTAKPKVIDKQLSRKLGAEYEAILRWALVGLDKYWALGGFPACGIVEKATKEYHDLLDPFQRWLDTLERTASDAKLTGAELFRSWDVFRCHDGQYGMAPNNVQKLTQKMRQKNFIIGMLAGYPVLRGYKIKPDEVF